MKSAALFGGAVPAALAAAASVGAAGRFSGPEAAALAAFAGGLAVLTASLYFAPRARAATYVAGGVGTAAVAAWSAARLSAASGAPGAEAAWLGAGIAVLWWLLLGAAAAPALALGRPEWGAVAALAVGGASLTTPWWMPLDPSFVPPSVVACNPWLLTIGVAGGADWIGSAGLYPIVGAAYTLPPTPAQTLIPWGAGVVGGIVLGRTMRRIKRAVDRRGAAR